MTAKDSKYAATPLAWAAEKGHEESLRLLLNRGAEIEAKDMFSRTPLSYVAGKGYRSIIALLLKKVPRLRRSIYGAKHHFGGLIEWIRWLR